MNAYSGSSTPNPGLLHPQREEGELKKGPCCSGDPCDTSGAEHWPKHLRSAPLLYKIAQLASFDSVSVWSSFPGFQVGQPKAGGQEGFTSILAITPECHRAIGEKTRRAVHVPITLRKNR